MYELDLKILKILKMYLHTKWTFYRSRPSKSQSIADRYTDRSVITTPHLRVAIKVRKTICILI